MLIPPIPMLIVPRPYQLLEPSLEGIAAVQVVRRPHRYNAMLVWVPGPGHREQTVEPGRDE